MTIFAAGQRAVPCLCIALVLLLGNDAYAFRTPFGDRVYDTVEKGLAWIRAQVRDGSYNTTATALGGLAILEHRTSRDWNAPARGYQNAVAGDKALLRSMAKYVINKAQFFWHRRRKQ